jgi:hypothetical protein
MSMLRTAGMRTTSRVVSPGGAGGSAEVDTLFAG